MKYGGNLLTMTDSYKVTHHRQYPPATSHVFSFLESRGAEFGNETLFFGLQVLLDRYLAGEVVTEEKIEAAREYFALHFGNPTLFNEEGWRHILKEHGGRLPVSIKAVPEGSRVPVSNVLVTMENTDPAVPWLTNYLETLLVQVWYPTTVATQSAYLRGEILRELQISGTPADIDFKLHDFGYRGSTSVESAGLGAAAHLVSFRGTDTLAGVDVAHDHYGEAMAGFSIPAAEHSTVTSWTRERDAFSNMLKQFPSGLVAVVSDSYDIFAACQMWGGELRDQVLERDGVLVVRPDSGDPKEVLPKVLDILGHQFGYERNEKGYKVLNPKVRVIQGDGINRRSVREILFGLRLARWSADNLAFGSGGGLLQQVDRDTLRFAFKCSAAKVEGAWRDVMKSPVTDRSKRSKAGRLRLAREADGAFRTHTDPSIPNELAEVFRNGHVVKRYSFDQVRARAHGALLNNTDRDAISDPAVDELEPTLVLAGEER